MAESDPEIEVRPDVAPGSLVFLDTQDLKERFILACCVIDDYLTETGVADLICEDHFPDLVSEIVLRACRCFGLAEFGMDPELLGTIYAELSDGLRQVR